MSFFFNDTATPSIYTLSLHDALPILRHGRRMQTGGNRPRNVRDVGKHPRADTARNLTDACEVDRAWIRRSTADKQFWTMFFGKPLQFVVVDLFRLFRHAVIRNLVTNTGKVHRMTVREVASVGQTHTENLIAILNRREIDRHVCLRATVRLHVRDRKSTRLNSSHGYISYAVFCLKK